MVVLGQRLVDDLSLRLGQTLRLQSSGGVSMVLTLSGIFQTGNGMIDGSSAFVACPPRAPCSPAPGGDADRDQAGRSERRRRHGAAHPGADRAGRRALDRWAAEQLMEALNAQAQTGYFLKSFALITIVIGVASALLLSTYRRRPEIGIMRAMGAGRGFVIFVFVTQGALIGLMGGLTGAALGYLALLPFPSRDAFRVGTLPMDITQGSYGLAITLTVIGAILASILPARAAARVDPVTAIGQ
jgi:lipoprotein-releasing system permease protein